MPPNKRSTDNFLSSEAVNKNQNENASLLKLSYLLLCDILSLPHRRQLLDVSNSKNE